MIFNLILILLLIAVLSWREVQILIDRGSWNDWDYYKLFWYKDQNSKEKYLGLFLKKNWDSFHVSNGVATFIILILIRDYLPHPYISVWFYIPAYWLLVWMQIRNLFMHKIFKR